MNSLSLLFFFPQTESLFTGYNIIYMYPVGLYTKNSYWKKLGFLLKLNLDTCTATEVSKLSCHTHCIVNTQIRTCHLRPPNIITHKIIPLLGRKCNKLCWHLMTRTHTKILTQYSSNFWKQQQHHSQVLVSYYLVGVVLSDEWSRYWQWSITTTHTPCKKSSTLYFV